MTEDQDPAMLTDADRKYLTGEKEYELDQAKYRRERKIASRIKNSLRDFELVHHTIDGRTWNRFLDQDPVEAKAFRDGMVATMALFYEIHQTNNWDFQDTLHRAVEEAYKYGPSKRGFPRKTVDAVDFNVDAHDPPDSDKIKSRLRRKIPRGDELTDREVREVVEAGDIETIHWLRDYFKERRHKENSEQKADRLNEDIESFGSPTEEPSDNDEE